jgi:hypothetical protein
MAQSFPSLTAGGVVKPRAPVSEVCLHCVLRVAFDEAATLRSGRSTSQTQPTRANPVSPVGNSDSLILCVWHFGVERGDLSQIQLSTLCVSFALMVFCFCCLSSCF